MKPALMPATMPPDMMDIPADMLDMPADMLDMPPDEIETDHAEDNPLIADFMRDFLRLIDAAYRKGADFRELEVIFENLAGLRDALRRTLGQTHQCGKFMDRRTP